MDNAINTNLAAVIINALKVSWLAAQDTTNTNYGWVQDPEAVAELAHKHHLANHNPTSMWDMGASPALYGAVRAELVAQDRFCNAVERNRLRCEGLRIARDAATAGQVALAF